MEKVEADLKRAFPQETWNRRHLQIIYFGREFCPAQRHDLAACPICSFAATKKQIEAEARARRGRRPAPAGPVDVVPERAHRR